MQKKKKKKKTFPATTTAKIQGVNLLELNCNMFKCVDRTLEKRTSKGDYCIKQCFSTITSLFNMGTALKGKNLLPEGANSFL